MQGFVGVRHDTTCPGLSDSATLPVQHRRAAQMHLWNATISSALLRAPIQFVDPKFGTGGDMHRTFCVELEMHTTNSCTLIATSQRRAHRGWLVLWR